MKKLLSSIGLAVGAMLVSAPASASIALTFTPSATHVNIGEGLTVEVRITGLGDEILSAFDLNFRYNPALVDWTLAEYFGANLGNTIGLNNNGMPNGDLGLDDSSMDDDATLSLNQANDFLLLRFSLVGTADGVTDFSLGTNPFFERNLVGLGGNTLNVAIGNTCIAVGTGNCTIPEPSTYALAGVALAGAFVPGALRRRRESTKA